MTTTLLFVGGLVAVLCLVALVIRVHGQLPHHQREPVDERRSNQANAEQTLSEARTHRDDLERDLSLLRRELEVQRQRERGMR